MKNDHPGLTQEGLEEACRVKGAPEEDPRQLQYYEHPRPLIKGIALGDTPGTFVEEPPARIPLGFDNRDRFVAMARQTGKTNMVHETISRMMARLDLYAMFNKAIMGNERRHTAFIPTPVAVALWCVRKGYRHQNLFVGIGDLDVFKDFMIAKGYGDNRKDLLEE